MVVKVSEQINRQNNTAYNNKFWGDAMYNAPIYGVVPGGTDVTDKLQALIDRAIEEGRRAIYFPSGEYYVTSLTDDDQVDFFGDNASFTGGYTGTIRQMGDWASTAQLADKAIQVEEYGAVGDGVTSDSLAFQSAINKAITTRFPAIQLTPGKTYLLKSSDVPSYEGVSIIGNGSKILLDGNVRFKLDNLEYFGCKNVEVETNVGLTEDNASTSSYNMFYVEGSVSLLIDVDGVYVHSSAPQTPKIARHPSVFSFSQHKKGSRIRNAVFENIGLCIYVREGTGIEISAITGSNVETLVYTYGPTGAKLGNIETKNTYLQSLSWIGKNTGTDSNGKSALLIERGNDVTISNLRGEFCIERVLYCQSSNVNAENLYAKDCFGFKFCGPNFANRVENVIARNLTKIMTDDQPSITNLADFYGLLDVYYASNVDIDGVTLKNFRSDKFTLEATTVIGLSDDTHGLRLKNIDVEYNSPLPMIFFFVLLDDTKTLSDIEISNFTMRNYGSSSGDHYIFGFSPGVPTSWVDGLNVSNGRVVQDENQVIGKDITRRSYDLLSQKAINIGVENIDEGYIGYISTVQDTVSTFDSSNISNVSSKSRNIIGPADANSNLSYTSSYATGASTLYLPKIRVTQLGVNYRTNSSFYDTLNVVYQNKSATAVRLYDAVESIEFDMLINSTLNNWNLPINITGKSYLVEVECSLGCGKGIFTGSTVTEMYKTGDLVFDSTSAKLRVRPQAGSGSDYYINISHPLGTNARLKVKVTLMGVT